MLQLRLTVAEAVGPMSHLMASDKLEEQIPKLLPALLSMYKKNNEHFVISKVSHRGLCSPCGHLASELIRTDEESLGKLSVIGGAIQYFNLIDNFDR